MAGKDSAGRPVSPAGAELARFDTEVEKLWAQLEAAPVGSSEYYDTLERLGRASRLRREIWGEK